MAHASRAARIDTFAALGALSALWKGDINSIGIWSLIVGTAVAWRHRVRASRRAPDASAA